MKKQAALWLVALTIFIDIAGFGLILPRLPFLALSLGASATMLGIIAAIYSLAQFLFTPFLGALSDRIGRRPVILASLLIEAVSFAITGLAGTLPLLLLGRFVGGLGASNIGTAQAVVADVTSEKDRAKGMGLIGASIGLGFVVGPAAGGVLSGVSSALPFWIASALALVNAGLVIFLLPETLTPSGAARHRYSLPIFAGWRGARQQPIVGWMAAQTLLFTIAFTGMETVFALFAQHFFGWGAKETGYIFTYLGVLVVIMQGGIVARLVSRWGERPVLMLGLGVLAAGLVLLPVSTSLALLLVVLGLVAAGEGLVSPTASTLLSRTTRSDRQGETLGFVQGFGGLGRIAGPLLAGGLYTLGGPSLAFIVSGAVALAALVVVALAIRPVSPAPAPGTVNLDESESVASASSR
jgi:multidrug resistance protein